jgi:RNA polymerase sigma factor (sigma-70 family)
MPSRMTTQGDDTSSDAALASAFLCGDRAAFEAIYNRYSPAIRRQCAKALRHPTDVDEAVQRTFTRLLSRLGSLADTSHLLPYLHTTARWACHDVRAGRSPGPVTHVLDGRAAAALVDPVDVAHDVERELSARTVLADITVSQASLLHERYLQDKPVAQMAAERDATAASIYVMLTRAKSAARRAAQSRGIHGVVPIAIPVRWRQSAERWVPSTVALLESGSMAAAVAAVAIGAASFPIFVPSTYAHYLAAIESTEPEPTRASYIATVNVTQLDDELGHVHARLSDALPAVGAAEGARNNATTTGTTTGTPPEGRGGADVVRRPVRAGLTGASGGLEATVGAGGESSSTSAERQAEPYDQYDVSLGNQTPVRFEEGVDAPHAAQDTGICEALSDGLMLRCSKG